jgi:hypothetical protein
VLSRHPNIPSDRELAMKAKVQTRVAKIEEATSRDSAILIVGLAMTALFVGMLILNAIS